jgi:hypothetical protein
VKPGIKRVVVSKGSRTVKGGAGWETVRTEIEQSLDENAEINITWTVIKEQPE